jgi:O-antigen ligase
MDRVLRGPRRAGWAIGAVLALIGALWGLLLGRLSLLNAALVTGLAAVAVGSLLEPLVGVGAALALGPLWAWLQAGRAPLPPLLGQYVFLMTVAIWIGRGLVRRRIWVPAPPGLLPLLAFMAVALISLWSPEDVWVGWWEWAKWAQILLMLLLVYDRLSREAGARRAWGVLLALAAAAMAQAAMGLWQFALRGDGPFPIDARFYRAYGTFEQPNPFAGFLGMVGALLVGVVAARAWALGGRVLSRGAGTSLRDRVFRRLPGLMRDAGVSIGVVLLAGAAGAVVAALGASWSRGGWMGFGAALLVMLAVLPRRGLWGVLLVLALILGGLGLYRVGGLPAPVADRLTGFLAYARFEDVRGVGIHDANFAVIERMAHWQAALAMWRDHVWLGVGFGCYAPAYPQYRLINWPHPLGHAHNYYLNLLAETGILGLIAYGVWWARVFWGLWRASRRCEGLRRGVALGLLGAWAHFAVHNLVDNILVNNVHLHLGVLLALGAWVIHEEEPDGRVLP